MSFHYKRILREFISFLIHCKPFFPPKAAPIATKKLSPPSTGTHGGGQQGGSPPPGPPGGPPPPGCPSATKTNNMKR